MVQKNTLDATADDSAMYQYRKENPAIVTFLTRQAMEAWPR